MQQQYSTNTLDVMLAQETAYLASDYLGTATRTPALPVHASPSADGVAVDADCRAKMAGWCDQCVDFCKFDREVVEITLNYLDRFASTPAGQSILHDRGEFQLAAMAALYMAIKVHQAEAVSSKSISALSRGRYGKDDIEAMEVRMITALQWRMNPVTVSAFVRAILDQILPTDSCCSVDTKAVYALAKIQTDAAVRDYTFCTIRPSVIAYCAILNAVEAITIAAPDSSTTTPMNGFLQTFLEQRLLLLTPHDLVGIQKYLFASIANTSRPVRQNPPSASRRRPPTPVAAADDVDDDDDSDEQEQEQQQQPSSSSSLSKKKVRRINPTGDSPRSSAVHVVVQPPPHC
jgi:Cyclin, N-terminal domain